MSVSERDWPDDYPQWTCMCGLCNRQFTGHKYRAVCRQCAENPPRSSWWTVSRWSWAFGFRSAAWAKTMGFTHRARLYGLLPCYYMDTGPDECHLEMRWMPLWWIEPVLRGVWALSVFFSGDDEPGFPILLGEAL